MADPTPYEAMRLFAEGLIEELEDEHSCTEVAIYRATLADIETERAEAVDLYRLREILADLTASQYNDEEEGGCVWCGNTTADGWSPAEPSDHAETCSWRLASELGTRLNEAGYVRPELLVATPDTPAP